MKKLFLGIALMLVACVSCTNKTQENAVANVPAVDSIIRVNCTLVVPADVRDSVVTFGKELVDSSRMDAGNIDYALYIDAADSSKMMIIETWSDQPSLDKHMAQPHFTRIVPQLQSLTQMGIKVFKGPKD
ncbi:putative quinol monooxygenase [Phocaeicola oris]|uniref:putative quinol monooxygenase n=1 Tax=Phocaeicola oris TaxID=2896850 RepID=UPI00234E88C3|nr:putative quinol monooxygenase [Phocaeicola oris]MCE2615397.1 antibiotic biosynthesis monooxygenase [Phocaeicola oris]